MINQLGTINLSADILAKANIGLWAFELDEGQPPRMYVDEGMLGLIGLTEQVSPEETYHAWYDHIDQSSYGLVGESVEKMTAGEHAEVQYPWHHPDGRVMIVRCGGVRNYNYTQGVRIEGTHQNVTEVLHLQQEKMAERDAFLKYFIEPYESVYYIGLTDLAWSTYKRTEELENSYPSVENYIESLGRYIDTEIHPNDRENARIMIQPEKIRERLAKQSSFSFTFRKITEKPEKILKCEIVRGADDDHIAMGFKNVTVEENFRREQSVMADLANQQRHLKAFGDMINAALWSMEINEKDEITGVYWSDKFRHQFGFNDTTDFPNTVEAWADRLHPDDREITLEDFYNGIRSKNTNDFVYDIKYRIKRKTGEYCWYHAVGRMEETEASNRRMYGVIADISADIKLGEQNEMLQIQQTHLEEALSMAQSANKAKTTFLNSMSHDIRTPMNAIIGYTGLAAKHIEDQTQVKNYLEKIEQSSNHLLSLINDVLDMSRIESGKMSIEEKPESISDIIDALDGIVHSSISEKHHDFRIEMVNITDDMVECDRLRLNQVLINILSNSIKYTPDGGNILLRVTEKVLRPHDCATFEFCISDNGMGMTEDFVRNIFEPFNRVKSSTMSGIQGTGLGMAITKNLVDIMNGKIQIKSAPGKGTETTVTFVFKLAGESGKATDTVATPENTADRDFTGIKVLLVEDNMINREIAMELLGECGFIIDTAEDGAIAVEKIRAAGAGDYDLVLMDIQMPVMDGYEATRTIRALGTDISRLPIIAMTANAFEEDRRQALEAGMNDHVAKPIDMELLKRTIAKYI